MRHLDLLLPQPARFFILLAVAAALLLLAGLGRLVAGTRRPAPGLFAGWGVAAFVITASSAAAVTIDVAAVKDAAPRESASPYVFRADGPRDAAGFRACPACRRRLSLLH